MNEPDENNSAVYAFTTSSVRDSSQPSAVRMTRFQRVKDTGFRVKPGMPVLLKSHKTILDLSAKIRAISVIRVLLVLAG